MKVSILTLGCKTNQAESSAIEADLLKEGWNIVELNESPEICIVNTCSVTEKSDYQSRQLIRRASKAGAKVIVTGCYSEINAGTVKSMDGVTTVVKNYNKINYIKEFLGLSLDGTLSFCQISKSRLFVKVQDGCNYSCSYCIIPQARGRSRSERVSDIISRINIGSQIYNEVILTGIHLGTYGYDIFPKVTLSNLIRDILSKTSIKRIRLSSIEIKEIGEELIDLIQEERICKHLHIPLQSGDDDILKKMNRTYSTNDYLKGIERIIEKTPEISIGTDIIVGFPGEGENEFKNTVNLLNSLPLSYIHVFPFSRRQGTKAYEYELKPMLSEPDKKERCALLRRLGKKKKREFMTKQIGKTLDLLVEEVYEDHSFTGITGNYLKVKATPSQARLKDIVFVRIADIEGDHLIGHLMEET